MKKLFISQPMRGKTDEEILAVRAQAIQSAERVLGEEVEVIDSFFKDAVVPSTVLSRPLWFLGESLKLLSVADVAYFSEGWEEARGCRIEHKCAVEYGITTIEDYRQATMTEAKREIADMPTADVAPVVHGLWKTKGYVCGGTEYQCTACGETEWRTSIARFRWCPFCGAKMDGGIKTDG